jgi:hypothetical protein
MTRIPMPSHFGQISLMTFLSVWQGRVCISRLLRRAEASARNGAFIKNRH